MAVTEWKKLNKRSLPPVDNGRSFLLCRGYRNPADRIMCIAKRVQYDGDEPYIRYIKVLEGWVYLPEKEYRDCLWAEIEYPQY